GGAAVETLQSLIHARVLHGAQATSRVISSLVVERNVTATNVESGLPPAVRADMDGDVAELRRHQGLVGLEVWEARAGRLVYADPGHPAGEQVMPAGERTASLRGDLVAVSRTGRDQATLDVFLPYDADGDHRPDAI